MPKTSRAGSGCNDCSCKPSSQDIPAPTLSHAQPAAGKRGFLQDLLAAAMAERVKPLAIAAWLVVGLPLAWGIWITLQKTATLFQ